MTEKRLQRRRALEFTSEKSKRVKYITKEAKSAKRKEELSSSPVVVDAPPIIAEVSQSSGDTYKFDMDTFLKTTSGRLILKTFDAKSQKFDHAGRSMLISSIIREHLENNICLTSSMMNDIANNIVHRFPGEDKGYYFCKHPRQSGRLYNKYRTMAATFKKSGLFTSILRNKSAVTPAASTSKEKPKYFINPVEEDLKIWLQKNTEPWGSVVEKWQQSFLLRRNEILTKPLNLIWTEWPLFAHSHGYRLLQLDFDYLHPGLAGNLYTRWETYEEKMILACKEFIKFLPAKNIIKNLSTNRELRRYEILKCLQAIVKPTARKRIGDDLWKISINDAWNCFAEEAYSIDSIPILLRRRRNFCASKNITLTPFLVIINEEIDKDPQFILVVEDKAFTFKTFLQALDIYFQIFHVLNLDFPFENRPFWYFIEKFFYEINENRNLPFEFSELSSFLSK